MAITRAVLYARVSTTQQAQEGVSLDSQLEMAQARCEAKGWHFAGKYVDVMSGKNDKRPELKRMMDAASKRAFDAVIVYKLDRLARSMRKTHEVLGVLQDNDIAFISLTQDFDTSTHYGVAMVGMLAVWAQVESDNTAERVKSSMAHIAAGGRRNWGAIPLGYAVDDGKFVTVEGDAEIVREVFRSFLQDRTLRGTADRLNALGYRSKTGSLFSYTSVRGILRNPIYLGKTVWQRSKYVRTSTGSRRKKWQDPSTWIVCENTHMPIVSQDDWDRAQGLLDENAASSPRAIFGKKYAWSGLIYCECGSVLRRHSQYDYRCSSMSDKGKSSCELRPSIGRLFLELRVVPSIGLEIREAIKHAASTPRKAKPKDDKARERRIKDLQSRREREKDLFRSGVTDIKEMSANIKRIDGELSGMKVVEPFAPKHLQISEDLMGMWVDLDEQKRGDLLRLLVERCIVTVGEFKIYPRFPLSDEREFISVPRENMRRYNGIRSGAFVDPQ